MAGLTARTDKQNEDRVTDIEGLRTRLATDSAYMEALASKTMGVFFSAYRTGAYSGGGENLTFNGAYCNSGRGLHLPHRRHLHVPVPPRRPRQQEGPALH